MSSRALFVSLVALCACAGIRNTGDASTVRARARPVRQAARPEARPEARPGALATAAKRSATEPIDVVVCSATVPEELSEALDVQAAAEAIARALWDEPLFRVRAVRAPVSDGVPGKNPCFAAASARGFVPDVWVFATAEKDDPVERIRRTGNLLATPTLTVRVKAASSYGTGRSASAASGPVEEAMSVVADAARAARDAILEDIAPDLPSHDADSARSTAMLLRGSPAEL